MSASQLRSKFVSTFYDDTPSFMQAQDPCPKVSQAREELMWHVWHTKHTEARHTQVLNVTTATRTDRWT